MRLVDTWTAWPFTARHGAHRGRAAALAVALVVTSGAATTAQSQTPPHWQVVPDSAGARTAAAVAFTMMPPGWHITTGPASLIFDPRRLLEDRFTLTTELFLFPESSHEGFGMFIGGNDLGGAEARYIALQLRRDGSAAVMQSHAGATTLLTEWTPIEAVGPHPGEGTQRITMRIEVDSTSVAFAANEAEFARLPRGDLDLDGRFGFRIGNGINLHVTRLDMYEQLAPPAHPHGL